jgi:Thiamine pyrophosphate enzyme, N-terminal TPP binding domain
MPLGTDFILEALALEEIDHLFMVPGGLVDPFLPALGRQKALKPIVAAQEGGAAYMADGYARASGKFGAALCIGGPGLANTVTALAAAQSDGSPVLLMSGEVSTLVEGLACFRTSVRRRLMTSRSSSTSSAILRRSITREIIRNCSSTRCCCYKPSPLALAIGGNWLWRSKERSVGLADRDGASFTKANGDYIRSARASGNRPPFGGSHACPNRTRATRRGPAVSDNAEQAGQS